MAAQEIELKLRVADPTVWDGMIAWLRRWELVDAASYRCEQMDACYYDTADGRLRRVGLAYRVRREGAALKATVKDGGTSVGGLHRRGEWNVNVAGAAADAGVFAGASVGPRLLAALAGNPLRPVTATRFMRHSMLASLGAARVEIAADRGEIEARGQTAPILEVELELKKGRPADVLKLGAMLKARYPLLPEERSKYERGLELAGFL